MLYYNAVVVAYNEKLSRNNTVHLKPQAWDQWRECPVSNPQPHLHPSRHMMLDQC